MILKKIIKRTDSLLEKVPALYESAFPDDERIETEKFMMMIENCRSMTFYAITEDNEFCGMAVIWELSICRYLLYLAVSQRKTEPKSRFHDIGTTSKRVGSPYYRRSGATRQ